MADDADRCAIPRSELLVNVRAYRARTAVHDAYRIVPGKGPLVTEQRGD